MLNWFLLAATLVIATAPDVRGTGDPAAQQLLDSVLTQHNFLRGASAPLVLEADFTGQANVPIQGHIRLRWQSMDHWWSRVDFGPYQQITSRNGEMEYTLRNYEFTPLQINDLFSLLDLDANLAPATAQKMSSRTEAGIALTCVEARLSNTSSANHEFCTNASTHDLLSESWNNSVDQPRSHRFADYVLENGVRYPRQLEMIVNSSKMVSARITLFQPMPFDSTLLEPQKGAIERRKCAGMVLPIPKKKRNINFGNHPGLDTLNTLALTIQTDGSVGEVYVIQSGGSIVDKPAVAAFRNWKFKPAMCGSEPVVADLTVEINYRTYRIARGSNRTLSRWTYRAIQN